MPNSNVKKVGSQSKTKRPEKGKSDDAPDPDLEIYTRQKVLLKPKDQLELTDAELKELHARQLSSINPQLPESIIEWSYAENQFVPGPWVSHMVLVFQQDGGLLKKDSEEARQQMIEMGIDPAELQIEEEEEVPEEEEVLEEGVKAEGEEIEGEGEGEGEGEAEEAEEESKPAEEEKAHDEHGEDDEGEEAATVDKKPEKKKGGRPRKLTNQFNFCERAALTYSNPTRSQETQTIPPPMSTFSARVTQSIIYDTYQVDYAITQAELEREKREKMGLPPKPVKKKTAQQIQDEMQIRIFRSARILERMINQNTYVEIAKDYRYWDDPSDDFRNEEGTVLPLWKMEYSKTKKHTVTDMEWNPYYYDLFAVCFGYLDYSKPLSEGALCLFSLKNPSFPDYICMTDSAVMCVDTHQKYPYMIVIGLYDGSVRVYNIQASCKEPAYKSNSVVNKHRAKPVYDYRIVPHILFLPGIAVRRFTFLTRRGLQYPIVKWGEDLPDGELNFFSVGADGKVNNWVLMQMDLALTTIICLHLDQAPVPGPDGTKLKIKACISCIKLHPSKPQIYLVGTEEGMIYKCSMAYSAVYLMAYNAHQMPVYRIDYNKFNTDIFISCSADWRVKIWEDDRPEPLFVFDIGDRVGDVKWAPYSSTVFACVTTDGKIHVYDLNVNKYKPICTQAIVSKKKNKTTRLSFNWNLPIMIIGDDKGCSTVVKLSPNLRIPCKAPKKAQHMDQLSLQLMKLDKLLSLVREPTTLTLPEDTAGTEED